MAAKKVPPVRRTGAPVGEFLAGYARASTESLARSPGSGAARAE